MTDHAANLRWIRDWFDRISGGESVGYQEQLEQAAQALKSLARENELLKDFEQAATQRIDNLEDENERLKDDLRRVRSVYDFAAQEEKIEELLAERNAIELKTMERCAAEADRWGDPQIRDAIHARKPAEDKNE